MSEDLPGHNLSVLPALRLCVQHDVFFLPCALLCLWRRAVDVVAAVVVIVVAFFLHIVLVVVALVRFVFQAPTLIELLGA